MISELGVINRQQINSILSLLNIGDAVSSVGSRPTRVFGLSFSPPPYEGCACTHQAQPRGAVVTGDSVVNVLSL